MAHRLQKWLLTFDYGLLIAIMIPLIGILPTLGAGLANGADAPFHAHRIYALSELIQNGQFYPRWVSYFHMGYGYPVFNFYAPGATHIGAWIHLLGFDVIAAYQLTNALMWCVGSVGMYWLARTFLPIRLALIACVLWVYAPSRFYEFWWQGSLAQIVATSFIPFVFYGIIHTTRHPSLKNSLWIAIPFALIVLSHTPTTYITALFVAPFCLLAPLPYQSPSRIIKRWFYIGCGLAISAGLAAIFLIPVFAEVGYVRIAGEFPDTIEFLRQGFGTVNELFSIPPLIDSTDVTLVMPRTLGLIGGILSVWGFVALLYRRNFKLAFLLLIGFGCTVFFALEMSLDVWLLIPAFRNLRFPERMLRMGAVFIALLGASSLLMIPKRWHTVGFGILSVFIIAQALPIMHPRDDDRTWDNLSAVDEITMEYTEKNWGTTAYDEYEPIWGEVTPLDMPPDVEQYIDHPLQIRILESDAIHEARNITYTQLSDNQLQVNLRKDLKIRFRQYYFPGWQLLLDGEPFPIQPDERFGLIEARLPEGQHIVQLDYIGTPIQHISTAISLITIIVCVVIVIRGAAYQSIVYVDNTPLQQSFVIMTIVGIVVFAGINVAWLQENIFRIHSPADKPYYMQTPVTDATFDDTVTLLGYTLDSNIISPDNPLGIRLYWKLHQTPEFDYRPIIQLVNLTVSESWAVSQPLDFEGGKIIDITLDQFLSDGHTLELLGDTPPYIGQISIQLLQDRNRGISTTLADGGERLMLSDVIRIDTPTQPYHGESANINFNGMLMLHCVGLNKTDPSQLTLDFWWEVAQSPSIDYKLFVHGLDEQNEIVTQADGFPFNGNYPTSYWLPTQTLHDSIMLDYDDNITAVAIGLYNPNDGVRVPVDINDALSDHITILPEETSCAP